jgi:hypothetical protein
METGVHLKFANGTYRFWLSADGVGSLQRECGQRLPNGSFQDKSVFEMYREFDMCFGEDYAGEPVYTGFGSPIAKDISKVLYYALRDGGEGVVDSQAIKVSNIEAEALARENGFPSRPLSEVLGVAWLVLRAAILGIKPADAKKKEPAKAPKKRTVKAQ